MFYINTCVLPDAFFFFPRFHVILGIFPSIQQCLEKKIYPTWRTAACLNCHVISTSSSQRWSPKVSLITNLSTTTVSDQRCLLFHAWVFIDWLFFVKCFFIEHLKWNFLNVSASDDCSHPSRDVSLLPGPPACCDDLAGAGSVSFLQPNSSALWLH